MIGEVAVCVVKEVSWRLKGLGSEFWPLCLRSVCKMTLVSVPGSLHIRRIPWEQNWSPLERLLVGSEEGDWRFALLDSCHVPEFTHLRNNFFE